MTNVLNLREMLNVAESVGLSLHNVLIWQKNTGNANRWYMKFAEYVLFLRKGPARTINNAGSSNIFAMQPSIINTTEKTPHIIEAVK